MIIFFGAVPTVVASDMKMAGMEEVKKKKKKKGKKMHKGKKGKKGNGEAERRDLLFKEDGQEYAQVLRMLDSPSTYSPTCIITFARWNLICAFSGAH